MKQKIVDFFQDENADWVTLLSCGHTQHVRHNPPWQNRTWVLSIKMRQQKIGALLMCKICDKA